MAAKSKRISIDFAPRQIERGEWGKKFYISTFRFPIKESQAFEKRAKALGLTMSSLANQLVMAFNKAVPEPKGNIKLTRTLHPTIWGADAKKKFFKSKGIAVPVKRVDEPKAKKTSKKVKAAKPKVEKKAPTKKATKKPVVKVVAKKAQAKPTKVAKRTVDVLARLNDMEDEAA